jgi:hypothetical protein
MPRPAHGVPDASAGRSATDLWIAAQAARRAAVDELFASMDKRDDTAD